MARTAKPWYWEARKAWYVNIDGKKIRLHENKREAERKFHKLMSGAGGGQNDEPVLIEDALEDFLESHRYSRASTRRLYVYQLGPFAAKFQGRRLNSIQCDEVIRFIGEYQGTGQPGKTMGDTSRNTTFGRIKTFFQWARDSGRTDVNPLKGRKCPWVFHRRTRVMTPEEYKQVMDTPRINEQFKLVLEFLWRSGARPGEIASISARHLDAKRSIVRLQPSEHKTGTKTGLQREIYMPDDLMVKLRELARDRPHGPLLRTRKGTAWTQLLISDYFRRVRRRLGLDAELVIYMSRHAFATRVIDMGYGLGMAAKMLGHTGTQTLMSTYYHPDTDKMLDAAQGKAPEDKSPEVNPEKPSGE